MTRTITGLGMSLADTLFFVCEAHTCTPNERSRTYANMWVVVSNQYVIDSAA